MNPEIKYLLQSAGKVPSPIVQTEEEVVEYLLDLVKELEGRLEVLHSISRPPYTDSPRQQEWVNDAKLQEPFG